MTMTLEALERASTSGNHPVDEYVGARIRDLRKRKKMSQSDLGDAIGVTFQQVQKYERGANRISVSMLWEIARALHMPVAEVLGGLPEDGARPDHSQLSLLAYTATAQAQELLRAAQFAPEEAVNAAIVLLAATVAYPDA